MPTASKRDPGAGSFLTEVTPSYRQHRSAHDDGGGQREASRADSSPPSSSFHHDINDTNDSGGVTTSVTPLSRRPSAARRPGWRVRLWRFLFPGEDTVGVEGAAQHYGHGDRAGVHATHSRDHSSDTKWGDKQGPVRVEQDDAIEPWHYMQVPLSRVILFLRLQQRLADQWTQFWMYAPFYALLLLFVFVGPGRGASQNVVDFTAARRTSTAQSSETSALREDILVAAFRLNTEENTAVTTTNNGGDFVPGNSLRYPWMYSWYNETVNIWTPPSDAGAAVDAQVETVAGTHHEPVLLTLLSVRTRRDVLRWLQLHLAPQLWNCRSPDYERQWRSTVTGAHHQLGAVRLVSRRYQQSGDAAIPTVVVTEGTIPSIDPSLFVEMVPEQSEIDEHNRRVATPTLYDKRAAPPQIPQFICTPPSASPSSADARTFDFDTGVEGYVVLLPFSSSCAAVRNVLGLMETPRKRVLWPPQYNSSLEMQALWTEYTETDCPTNVTRNEATSLCSSFVFDPAVSEVLVQYVEYDTKTNKFTLVEVSFAMSTSGAVVRPRLYTYSLHALQWRSSFTTLAFSISLAMTIIFYGNYLLRRMVAQYTRRFARIARLRRGASQRLWCALRVATHTQNLVHIFALVMASAAVGSWWHTLVSLTSVPGPRYADRGVYPQQIDDIVRQNAVLLPRLCASAVFFATSGLMRFASITPGLWMCTQTIAVCSPRLVLIFGFWMMVNVGVAMLCVLLYGTALSEFRCFQAAFTTLIFMFLDGGRSVMNTFVVQRQTGYSGIFAQDNARPGIRGSRLGRTEPVPVDHRAVTLSISNLSLFPGFLLFFFYLQSLVLLVWGALTILESYRSVLLLPEAETLPLWRGMWTLRFSSLTRAATAEYAKETIRRLLLARDEAVMLRDIEYYLRLGYARAPAAAPVDQRRGGWRQTGDVLSHAGSGETAVSLTMVLWLLPRELQPEYGAAHLRRLWYLCVAAVMAAQRYDQPWRSARWRQHWEQQPSSLSGWLRASLPADDTIEGQAARVGLQLEELPNSVVRYVEGKFM